MNDKIWNVVYKSQVLRPLMAGVQLSFKLGLNSKPKLTKSTLDDVSDDPLKTSPNSQVLFHWVAKDAQKYTSRDPHFRRMRKLAKIEGFLSQACD